MATTEPGELIPYDTSRNIASLIAEFHDRHTSIVEDAYVFDAEMLSNTRLQNFLMTIDHRSRPALRELTMPAISSIIERGLSSIIDQYEQLEYREASQIFNFGESDVLLRASGFVNTNTGALKIIRYTKKFKVERMIENIGIGGVFDYSLYASAFLSASRYPATSTIIQTIHEDLGKFHITEHFPYISSIHDIRAIIQVYFDDINSGELPPECEDKWTTRAGVHSRCEKYCSVRDICPFYNSPTSGS